MTARSTATEFSAAEFSAEGSFGRYMDRVPSAFAVTRGSLHTLVYANAAFHALVAPGGEAVLGASIANALASGNPAGLTALLDRAFRTGVVSRDRRGEILGANPLSLGCTVWPDLNADGRTEHLVIELRVATQADLTVGLQRDMTERLLLSALREKDAADVSEESRRGATFVASESRRLSDSLDEGATLAAMAGMSLPRAGVWCIVDTLDEDDTMRRLAIVHPDPSKQPLLDQLEGRWVPEPGDGFGLPAALRGAGEMIDRGDVDRALANAKHDPRTAHALEELGAGPLLTVPLISRKHVIGAITFVGARDASPFTQAEFEMAADLANRSALALDRARLFGKAIEMKARAEAATQVKSSFLSMISHELRTPLNAIGGYVDLMDMEIHGPVTGEQHADLDRIRSNQRYLMGLISDILNFTKVGSGELKYESRDIIAREVLAASVRLVEPLIVQKQLVYETRLCDETVVTSGDRERVIQILVNLLSNAIKFTAVGGCIVTECEATTRAVHIRVSDTGIGIPAEKLEDIFEPFVQVKGGLATPEAGIGLGLAISRGLARGMGGELTVESALGDGSRFTLTLPRSLNAERIDG